MTLDKRMQKLQDIQDQREAEATAARLGWTLDDGRVFVQARRLCVKQADGRIDVEPAIRYLAQHFGADPCSAVAEARQNVVAMAARAGSLGGEWWG